MIRKNKFLALLFLGLTIAAMLLLSISLHGLNFQPGQPFSFGTPPPAAGGPPQVGGSDFYAWLLKGLLALGIILLPIYILISLFTPEGRRRLLVQLTGFVLLIAAFLLLSNHSTPPLQISPASTAGLPSQPMLTSPPSLPPFVASSSTGVEWGIMLGLAALIAVVAFLIYRNYRQREIHSSAGPFDRLAREAQGAVNALAAGEDIRDVVLRSYYQMSRVLDEERGIRREVAMTPHEFLHTLISKGIPNEPARELTLLFEEVRYGSRRPGKPEEQRAIASLQAIINYCNNSWRPGGV
jgi:hypothetical protein